MAHVGMVKLLLLVALSFQACCVAFISDGLLPSSLASTLTGMKSKSRQQRSSISMTLPDGISGAEKLERFFRDCELLGACRFVCMTEGAILESVGSFENLRYNDLPKGRYATFSDDKGRFEAHINTDKVKSVAMLEKPSNDGQQTLYITRWMDANQDTLLSSILASGEEGEYEEGAVDYWHKLKQVFGEEWVI